MHPANQRSLLTLALCSFSVAVLFTAGGCTEKEKSHKYAESPTKRVTSQPPGTPARQKVEQPASRPVDAGAIPSSLSVSQKRRQDTKDSEINVLLRVIFVSKEHKNVDPRIKELAAGFVKEFKEYELTNFVQLDIKELKLNPGQTVPVALPGERRLQITNGGIRDKKVVLGLEMAKLIKTTVLLSTKGKVSFGGPKYKFGKGMIILVVKARPSDK